MPRQTLRDLDLPRTPPKPGPMIPGKRFCRSSMARISQVLHDTRDILVGQGTQTGFAELMASLAAEFDAMLWSGTYA